MSSSRCTTPTGFLTQPSLSQLAAQMHVRLDDSGDSDGTDTRASSCRMAPTPARKQAPPRSTRDQWATTTGRRRLEHDTPGDSVWPDADRCAFELANAQALQAACPAEGVTEQAVLDVGRLGRWNWPYGRRRHTAVLAMTDDGRGWQPVQMAAWPSVYARAATAVQRQPATAADVGRLARTLPDPGTYVVVDDAAGGHLYRHRVAALCCAAIAPALRFGLRDAQLLWVTAAPRTLCFSLAGGDVLLFAEPVAQCGTVVFTHTGGRHHGRMDAMRAATEALGVGDEVWPGMVITSVAESPLTLCHLARTGSPLDDDQVVVTVERPGGGCVCYFAQSTTTPLPPGALTAGDWARLAVWGRSFNVRDTAALFRAFAAAPFPSGADPRERVTDSAVFGYVLAELDAAADAVSGFLDVGEATRDAIATWARDSGVTPPRTLFASFRAAPPLEPEKAALIADPACLVAALTTAAEQAARHDANVTADRDTPPPDVRTVLRAMRGLIDGYLELPANRPHKRARLLPAVPSSS